MGAMDRLTINPCPPFVPKYRPHKEFGGFGFGRRAGLYISKVLGKKGGGEKKKVQRQNFRVNILGQSFSPKRGEKKSSRVLESKTFSSA